ncbi:MAG: hypothetical protein WEG36_09010 [Gemmatimonadota bacterium]
MSERFRPTLPPHPDFDQQKKLAKELLRAFRAGKVEAQARISEQLPGKVRITLADAQFVLAREYNFGSWACSTPSTTRRPPVGAFSVRAMAQTESTRQSLASSMLRPLGRTRTTSTIRVRR